MNDLFYFITDTDVCNYADDTTLYATDSIPNSLIKRLEDDTEICVKRFYWNYSPVSNSRGSFTDFAEKMTENGPF